MVNLNDLFSPDDLRREIDEGYVRERLHPHDPLAILNYTAQAQYSHHWSDVTRQARGLIYNTETLEVVSRPFAKFFNIDQVETPTPPQGAAMIRSEKMDGSLGVLYRQEDDTLAVATRGSFVSDQAVHATHWLTEHLSAEADRGVVLDQLWNPTRTFLFEIVYPENRIVVDYGDLDALVLLDVIDNETGRSDLSAFDELDWPLKADKDLIPGGFYDTIFSDIPEGNEGFVLYWPHSGVRAKVKAARYLELHRIVFGLSEKSIWQAIENGQSIEDFKEDVPDEFYEFVDNAYRKMLTEQLRIFGEVTEAWNSIANQRTFPVILTRKNFAMQATKHKNLSKYLFRIFDGADSAEIQKMIWSTIKPSGDTRMTEQSEDVA